ncbi:MAG: inorganic diphosphatase [Clostridiales bacterium]|jgi:inorganic pyrophosphatase|nr:inorganic diphosphatase [Clostridiales bacterium]
MNLWHGVRDERIKKDDFLAVIEIKKGKKNKYELDKETGVLILDRVLYTAMRYPANYGFIPLTLAEDNDPLDVLVIASEEIDPMTLVRCYSIGAIRMTDGGQHDDKIIAIPFNDPTYNHIRDLSELSPHLLDEYVHFFTVYKQLEKKQTDNLSVLNLEEANRVFDKSLAAYKAKFGK